MVDHPFLTIGIVMSAFFWVLQWAGEHLRMFL